MTASTTAGQEPSGRPRLAATNPLYAYGDAPLADLIDSQVPLAVLAAERRNKPAESEPFPEPEDRGKARLSTLGKIEYVDDWGRPGRIVVVAGEEGTGKTMTFSGELGIRFAIAGGDFAGTWPVEPNPVLVMSEMHPDEDYQREERILEALHLPRTGLIGGYFRLPLMTAAGDEPPLKSAQWCAWITEWMRSMNVRVFIVDTATAASNVDPWGSDIQAIYRRLRGMLDDYPELLIILTVHLKKPQGRGERRLSDVLGEWGRWNDVTILMENDGASLERVKISVRKRVRHERRIIATKRNGLLVDPEEVVQGRTTKVPLADVVAAIAAQPGITAKALGDALGVSKDTAQRYALAAEAGDQVRHDDGGPRGSHRYYATGEESEDELLAQL